MMNSYKKKMVLALGIISLSTGMLWAGCGACGPAPKAEKTEPEEAKIETHTLERLIASGVDVTILDARSGKWDDGKRIPGAKSLAPSASAKEISKVIKSKESLIVTYCSNTKCGASSALAKNLAKKGYKNILEYPVGIKGWEEHGGKVVKTK